MPDNITAFCPYCGRSLQSGDGAEIPFLYCANCGISWDSYDDLNVSFAVLEDDKESSADLDTTEQWMWDHGGYSYQESPDPSDEPDDIPPFIEGEDHFS
jgi:Zn-finger nucleic acid-binding protein